jgi:glycosyltransferase involved in cell wall biosynthesis
LNKVYDVAIGFMELWPNAYVSKCIKAKKKIGWVHSDYIGSGLELKYDRKSYSRLDYIVGVAKSSVETLKSLLPELKDRIIMIENINNIEYIRERAGEVCLDIDNAKEDIVLISVNRLDCYCKGIDRGVVAAAKLKEEGFNFKWYIIGDGEDKNKILAMIKEYSVEDCFILLGKKINPYPYIAKADLFVLCSRYEGKPITVTEAQILSIPVLVTNYKSAAEQVMDGENGMIVENNDLGVYNGLKKLLTHPDLLKGFKEKLSEDEDIFNNKKEIEKLYDLIEGDGAYNGENR